MKRMLAGVSAAAVVLATAAPAMADTLKIGALVPLTGDLQSYGETSYNGIKLAAKEINESGGVFGNPVEIVVGDTQTTPQIGVDAAQKLVNLENVSGLVGALSSGVTIPVAKSVAAVAGVPQISGASTSPEITTLEDGDFLFRTVPTDAVQGVALAQLVDEAGIGNVGIVYVNNDYGKGLADAFAENFEARGGTTSASIAYEKGQASYRGELQKAAAEGAEALLLIAYPENGITILKNALEGGYFNRFVFTDGMKAPEIIEAIGAEYLNGAFGSAAESQSEGNARFRELYQAEFGEYPPKPYIDTAYDATMLLALAAVKAGSPDPVAVRDALRFVANPPGAQFGPGEFADAKAALEAGEDIDWTGGGGPENFDDNGDVSGTYAHWVITDGKIETVKVFEPAM